MTKKLNGPGPVVFLGLPGAGKGTQARELANRLGIPHISTGAMLRYNVEKDTKLGQIAKNVIEAGDLVGDQLVNEMVKDRLTHDDCIQGFLLDGYPRTYSQAITCSEILKEMGQSEPIVVHLMVGYNAVVRRLSARRVCPVCNRNYNLISQPPAMDSICNDDGEALQQRADDSEAAVRERLNTYEAQTKPVLDYYRSKGRFYEIDADRAPERVSEELIRLLNIS
jgi:adenylate kinase